MLVTCATILLFTPPIYNWYHRKFSHPKSLTFRKKRIWMFIIVKDGTLYDFPIFDHLDTSTPFYLSHIHFRHEYNITTFNIYTWSSLFYCWTSHKHTLSTRDLVFLPSQNFSFFVTSMTLRATAVTSTKHGHHSVIPTARGHIAATPTVISPDWLRKWEEKCQCDQDALHRR